MITPQSNSAVQPVSVLALMMFLVPALGVPSELMLQDTLKSAIAAFGILIAALVFFWQQRNRTEPLLWHGLVWLPLALMAYALGSMVWSHTYLAGVEAIRWFLLALLLWLGLNTLTKDNIPTLLWGIHGGAVVASMWVALQFWFDLQWFPQAAAPASTFINRNFFAEYAVSVLPLSLWLLASMKQSPWLGVIALSIALDFIAILMTGTRSALWAMWIAFPVLLFVLIYYRHQIGWVRWPRPRKALVFGCLVIGIAAMGAMPSGNPMIPSDSTPFSVSANRTVSAIQAQEFTQGSFSVRAIMWKATARMVMDRPLTGVGAGAWEVHIPQYQNSSSNSQETDFYAHNEYIQLLGEYGAVVGGLVLATMFAYLILAASQTVRAKSWETEVAPLRAFILTSLLVLLLVSNAGFPWHLAGCGALLAIHLGLLASTDAQLPTVSGFGTRAMSWRTGYSRLALGFLLGALALAWVITFQAAQVEKKIISAIQLTYVDESTANAGNAVLAARRALVLQKLKEGIAINPHYRKMTALAADRLLAGGNRVDALRVLESIAASRPYIADVWANIALANLELGYREQAQVAYLHLAALQPDAPRTQALAMHLSSELSIPKWKKPPEGGFL